MNEAKGSELKAEPMSTSQLDRWLKGDIPRRILVLPYGGPLKRPGAPYGVDIDAEWFDAETDTVDGHAALKASRERIVDFHHEQDPTGGMKGAILGRVEIDDTAERVEMADGSFWGRWGDFWANAGEKRRQVIAELEKRGVLWYGSSQAAYKKADPTNGHILKWPLIRHTITTSPQNPYAVMPALKALLASPLDDVPADALKALLVGLDASEQELLLGLSSGTGSAAVKAGRVLSHKNEAVLRELLQQLASVIDGWVEHPVAPGEPNGR